jgi:hypothetical protein
VVSCVLVRPVSVYIKKGRNSRAAMTTAAGLEARGRKSLLGLHLPLAEAQDHRQDNQEHSQVVF